MAFYDYVGKYHIPTGHKCPKCSKRTLYQVHCPNGDSIEVTKYIHTKCIECEYTFVESI